MQVLRRGKEAGGEAMQADLWMFMGQSNMAGRGITSEKWPETAPELIPGAGWEYRAVSAPFQLFPIAEPFGKDENRQGGINDGTMKTGSLVTSFVNAWYARTRVPVLAVSASKGGSCMKEWQPGSPYLNDAMQRMHDALAFMQSSGHTVPHRYVLWCQGETDGDLGTEEAAYRDMFLRMLDVMRSQGIEKLMMIAIGQCNLPGAETRYDAVNRWQKAIAAEREDVCLVSTRFESMREEGLMKDAFHYYQRGYNLCGEDAGKHAADALLSSHQGADCTKK